MIQLVDRLMSQFPPDMNKTDDDGIVRNTARNCEIQTETIVIYRPCYSGTQLQEMLQNPELVSAICQANEGKPMWTDSVRNFLIAWYSK